MDHTNPIMQNKPRWDLQTPMGINHHPSHSAPRTQWLPLAPQWSWTRHHPPWTPPKSNLFYRCLAPCSQSALHHPKRLGSKIYHQKAAVVAVMQQAHFLRASLWTRSAEVEAANSPPYLSRSWSRRNLESLGEAGNRWGFQAEFKR
jgi:hypothetical protein